MDEPRARLEPAFPLVPRREGEEERRCTENSEAVARPGWGGGWRVPVLEEGGGGGPNTRVQAAEIRSPN